MQYGKDVLVRGLKKRFSIKFYCCPVNLFSRIKSGCMSESKTLTHLPVFLDGSDFHKSVI